jgi:hypothetical protein
MGDVSDYKTNDSIYEEFLFTEIGEQENGMPLSMVSALARLGLDPWDEARRLAALPATAAVAAVGDLIKRTSAFTARASALPSLPGRLVALLTRPAPAATRVISLPGLPSWLFETRWLAAAFVIGMVIMMSRLFLQH